MKLKLLFLATLLFSLTAFAQVQTCDDFKLTGVVLSGNTVLCLNETIELESVEIQGAGELILQGSTLTLTGPNNDSNQTKVFGEGTFSFEAGSVIEEYTYDDEGDTVSKFVDFKDSLTVNLTDGTLNSSVYFDDSVEANVGNALTYANGGGVRGNANATFTSSQINGGGFTIEVGRDTPSSNTPVANFNSVTFGPTTNLSVCVYDQDQTTDCEANVQLSDVTGVNLSVQENSTVSVSGSTFNTLEVQTPQQPASTFTTTIEGVSTGTSVSFTKLETVDQDSILKQRVTWSNSTLSRVRFSISPDTEAAITNSNVNGRVSLSSSDLTVSSTDFDGGGEEFKFNGTASVNFLQATDDPATVSVSNYVFKFVNPGTKNVIGAVNFSGITSDFENAAIVERSYPAYVTDSVLGPSGVDGATLQAFRGADEVGTIPNPTTDSTGFTVTAVSFEESNSGTSLELRASKDVSGETYQGSANFNFLDSTPLHITSMSEVANQPDLVPTDITPDSANEGDSVNFTVTVLNSGDEDVSTFDFQVSVDGAPLGSPESGGAIVQGDSDNFTFTVPYTAGVPGDYTVSVEVSNSSPAESNTANNSYSETFTVTAPGGGPGGGASARVPGYTGLELLLSLLVLVGYYAFSRVNNKK